MVGIHIVGAGPAGSAAALAALQEGARVRISDRARATRHKVCGEFISPEISNTLQELGVWPEFLAAGPARLRRCVLHFGARVKQWILPETAFGLSRLALDGLLLDRAIAAGAALERGVTVPVAAAQARGVVLASGRRTSAPAGSRLFGFKAHFSGPATDAVELYFTKTGYVGINPIERNLTNVCGLAPEHLLRESGFDLDEFVNRSRPLTERLKPLSRCMDWLTTGPLVFSRPHATEGWAYPAGDALGFVDPFTGSGILNALLTGRMAGRAVAREQPVADYLGACRERLNRPALVSALFRMAVERGYAEHLAWLVPGQWIYRLTRVGRG